MDKTSILTAAAALLTALAGTGGNYLHTKSTDQDRAKKWAMRQLDAKLHDCKTDLIAESLLGGKPLRKDLVQYCYDLALSDAKR